MTVAWGTTIWKINANLTLTYMSQRASAYLEECSSASGPATKGQPARRYPKLSCLVHSTRGINAFTWVA